MRKKVTWCVPLVLIFLIITGCSGGNEELVLPPSGTDNVPKTALGYGGQAIMGLWQVVVDKNTERVEINQLRTADLYLNALSFMEPPALSALSIDFNTLQLDPIANTINVDVLFTHPFITPDGVFMGMDVRGVVFGPDIDNADGYTPLLGPADFSGFPFGYIDGLLGVPHSQENYQGERWPYKYFADGIGLNETVPEYYSNPTNLANRGRFPEGATIARHYDLDFGPFQSDFLVFNYAVLASFDFPLGDGPYNLDDFSITTANIPEPFAASISITENSLYFFGGSGGGQISLDAEVYDWQGVISSEVTIASFDGTVIPETPATSSEPGSTPFSRLYHFNNIPGEPTGAGELKLVLKATDETTTIGDSWLFGFMPNSNPWYNINAYNMFPVVGATGPPIVTDEPLPQWNPELFLAAGYGTVCRTGSKYPDSQSNYDFDSQWEYTGGEPLDPQGLPTGKWYYLSTSTTDQVGSPVGWTEFTTVGYFDVNWDFYDAMAPDRVYLWVRAENGSGYTSDPVRWTNDGGEIELCSVIRDWGNNFSSNWNVTGFSGCVCSGGNYMFEAAAASFDTRLYTVTSWVMGDLGDTSKIAFEFSRLPSGWTLSGGTNVTLRVSNDGGGVADNIIETWDDATYGSGTFETVDLPATIGGTDTVGSTRSFALYIDSIGGAGTAYYDNIGIYAHPI